MLVRQPRTEPNRRLQEDTPRDNDHIPLHGARDANRLQITEALSKQVTVWRWVADFTDCRHGGRLPGPDTKQINPKADLKILLYLYDGVPRNPKAPPKIQSSLT
jgi:hypothetical protein